jgi:hypothetical protein
MILNNIFNFQNYNHYFSEYSNCNIYLRKKKIKACHINYS